ncbi:MAG: zf-HC2 domain-containing protein [Acidobacteriota bacterium]
MKRTDDLATPGGVLRESMTHPAIDDRSVVEHYVTGKLSPAETEAFEEHYLSCPACIRAIEDAERLHRGLAHIAAEDVALRQTSVLVAAWHAVRTGPGAALLAVVVAVALLPAGLAWQQARDLGVALDTVREELLAERQPRINTPILSLAPTRSGEQPLQQISVAAEPEWLVLAIELGDTARPRYEAVLATANGDEIWRADGLEPDYRGVVSLSLHSSLLPPERYVLRLTASADCVDDADDDTTHRLQFPLRIVAF